MTNVKSVLRRAAVISALASSACNGQAPLTPSDTATAARESAGSQRVDATLASTSSTAGLLDVHISGAVTYFAPDSFGKAVGAKVQIIDVDSNRVLATASTDGWGRYMVVVRTRSVRAVADYTYYGKKGTYKLHGTACCVTPRSGSTSIDGFNIGVYQ